MRTALFGISLLLLAVTVEAEADVVIVANKSVPARSIDSRSLYDLYSGDIRRWDNGEAIVLLDLNTDGNTRDVFYRFLGKSPTRMKSIWMKNMLSGEGGPPESLTSETVLLEKVASTPGAIGYVSRATLEAAGAEVITLGVIPEPGAK